MIIKLLKPLSFLPALLLMYMIYSFSAQEGDVSSELSYKVSYKVVEISGEILDADFEPWEIDSLANRFHTVIRKLAHMTEYFALAVAVAFPLYVYGLRGILLMIVAGGICVAFACGDEYHQSFVSGRSPSKRDVAIDSFGVFWGIILVRIIGWTGRKTIFRPFSGKKRKKEAYREPDPQQGSAWTQQNGPRVSVYPPADAGHRPDASYGKTRRAKKKRGLPRQEEDYGNPYPQNSAYNSSYPQQGSFYDNPHPQNGAYGSSSAYNSPYPQNGAYNSPHPQNSAYGSSSAYNSPYPQNSAYGSPYPQNDAYNSPHPQNGAYGSPYPQNGAYNSPHPQNGAYGSSSAYGSPYSPNGAYGNPRPQQLPPSAGERPDSDRLSEDMSFKKLMQDLKDQKKEPKKQTKKPPSGGKQLNSTGKGAKSAPADKNTEASLRKKASASGDPEASGDK